MSNYLIFLSCALLLLLIGQTSCVKRQLINFQVNQEDDNLISSVLHVDSLVDLSSELRLFDEQNDKANDETTPADHSSLKKPKVFDASIDVKLPIPIKINGQLRMIDELVDKLTDQKASTTDAKPNASEPSLVRTLYRLNMTAGELYRMTGDVNRTQRGDWNEFTSDLNFESLQSGLAGKYKGTLRLAQSGGCPALTLYHNFTTNVANLIHFSSNVTEQCGLTNPAHPNRAPPNDTENETGDQRNITINFSNLINDLYDFKLDQTFDWRSTGGSELMTLLNKIYKITVSGQYDNGRANEDGYQFYKRAVFESSVPSQFPTFQIKYSHDEKSKNKIKLSFELKNDRRPASGRKEERKNVRNESRDGKRDEL